ncbi:hypothetical protein [Sphingomonas mucosissima]|uniref:Uncharacterized protein n=1 Tax=Sphingomonas mucosissima TaxID=370959 RepID=A0A245ZRD8_9SPHN|nr:hypothetical protein [Sphingomonas mucosissima]OWK32304.1 hypothetical protein SPMU_06260 [Sphingomonas mucosissima]
MADFDDLLAGRNEPLLNALAPLAGRVGLASSEKAPVTAPGNPFAPTAGRPFNITVSGGTFTAQVERRFGGAGDWFVVIPDSMRASLPPSFSLTEAEVGVQYRVTVLTGTATTVRISQ